MYEYCSNIKKFELSASYISCLCIFYFNKNYSDRLNGEIFYAIAKEKRFFLFYSILLLYNITLQSAGGGTNLVQQQNRNTKCLIEFSFLFDFLFIFFFLHHLLLHRVFLFSLFKWKHLNHRFSYSPVCLYPFHLYLEENCKVSWYALSLCKCKL